MTENKIPLQLILGSVAPGLYGPLFLWHIWEENFDKEDKGNNLEECAKIYNLFSILEGRVAWAILQ